VHTHQPLDTMQPAWKAFSQKIAPDPACTVRPIAGDEAGADLGAELLVAASCGHGGRGRARSESRCAQHRALCQSTIPARSRGASRPTRTSYRGLGEVGATIFLDVALSLHPGLFAAQPLNLLCSGFTASSLILRLNFRRCIFILQFQKHLIFGVHGDGSSSLLAVGS
jgi:hypothetical protein